jgi:hypothetical protein
MSMFSGHDHAFSSPLDSGWILTPRDGGTIYKAGDDCVI